MDKDALIITNYNAISDTEAADDVARIHFRVT